MSPPLTPEARDALYAQIDAYDRRENPPTIYDALKQARTAIVAQTGEWARTEDKHIRAFYETRMRISVAELDYLSAWHDILDSDGDVVSSWDGTQWRRP